jgi:hypothetical protein
MRVLESPEPRSGNGKQENTMARKTTRKILGLPIEGTTDLVKALITTSKKAKAKPEKKAKAPKAPKIIKLFSGTVDATKVFKRKMPEFKNCQAFCWLIINDKTGNYTSANSYNGETPKHSYDPGTYTYELTEKTQKHVQKKLLTQGYSEIEVTEWPTWITNVAGTPEKATKRGRKSKAVETATV